MDQTATKGFAGAAAAYQAARPQWPLEAVEAAFSDWLLDPAEGLVVDLAAGTGRLTDQLAKVCPHLLAIEPVAEMRARIHNANAVPGTAEDIPVGDAKALAVFVGEAFHWFDYDAALGELARILRPGGGLAVMWNNPVHDASEDELRVAIADLLRPYAYHPKGRNLFAGDPPQERAWLAAQGWKPFAPVSHHEFFHEQEMTREGLVRMVASWSFVGALDESLRAEVLCDVDRLLAERGIERHLQRYRCDMYLTRKR